MQIVELPIEGISQISNGISATEKFFYSTDYDEENYQDLIYSLKKEGESSIIEPKRFRYEYNLYPLLKNDIIEIENPNDNVMIIEFVMIKPINVRNSYDERKRDIPICRMMIDNEYFDVKMTTRKQILIQIPLKISIINLSRSDSIIKVRSSSKLSF